MNIVHFISKKTVITITVFFMFSFESLAQIYESTNNSVYPFLYRMAQKGVIDFNDVVLPLDRKEIYNYLYSIKSDTTDKRKLLTTVENTELGFYLQDFYYDNDDNSFSSKKGYQFLKLDKTKGRFRTFIAQHKNVKLFVDPVFGMQATKYGNGNSTSYFNGLRTYGYLGKNIGFNFFFRDITDVGDSLDITRQYNSQQGFVNTSNKSNQLNFSNINFNLGYVFKNGSLSIGKDNLNWGYGQAGKIVLSSKAPSYLFVRLKYQPFKWLDFNYFHGSLQSDLVDSANSYTTGVGVAGGYREVYRKKFIANHSITIKPLKGLDIAIGESMVYSDQFDIGYLIPINFFKAYDQYLSKYALNGGSNGQFFGQISSRNHLKKTHLFVTLFIDEINLSNILDKQKSRNQVGYTLGANRTDLLLPNLSLGVEFTKVRGGVYNNVIPAQTYYNSSFALGDWMGQNAERLFIYSAYSPIPRMRVDFSYQFIRKGDDITIEQQYSLPSPGFIEKQLYSSKEISASLSYEFLNTLKAFGAYKKSVFSYPSIIDSRSRNSITIGFTYGM